jgi:hypothetical protein
VVGLRDLRANTTFFIKLSLDSEAAHKWKNDLTVTRD